MVGQTSQHSKLAITVAGIDASLTSTGICVFTPKHHYLSLVRPGKQRGAERLLRIRNEVIGHILQHEKPDLVALEGYSHGSEGRWFDLGEAGGIIKVELLVHDIPYIIVPPSTLKKFATGNGHAPKKWMIREAAENLGIRTRSDDLADAAWLARFAYVVLTNDSMRRCEIETVKKFTKKKGKNDGTKETKHTRGHDLDNAVSVLPRK